MIELTYCFSGQRNTYIKNSVEFQSSVRIDRETDRHIDRQIDRQTSWMTECEAQPIKYDEINCQNVKQMVKTQIFHISIKTLCQSLVYKDEHDFFTANTIGTDID